MLNILKIISAIALTVLLVAFCVANREFVTVSLFPLPYSAEMPKSLAFMVCLTLGILIGGLCGSMALLRQKRQLRREKITNAALSNELKLMRMEQDERQASTLLPS